MEIINIDVLKNNWPDLFSGKGLEDVLGILGKIWDGEDRVLPLSKNVFKAFELTSYNDVKVVIIGQDPYHSFYKKKDVDGNIIMAPYANGLAFSVNKGAPLPGSLKNIYKALQKDLGVCRVDGDLSSWAKQGVLLLNLALTVRAGEPLSHVGYWKEFSGKVLELLNEHLRPIIFVLLGRKAEGLKKMISDKHYVISAPHPSPLAGNRFVDSECFKKIDDNLKRLEYNRIDWGA